jgi:general secretion pathway protein D
LLTACAGTRQYEEGKQALASGDWNTGLSRLEEAVAAAPGNAEYRAALLRAREQRSRDLIGRADTALRAGALDEAASLYSQLLAFEPGNARARHAVREIERRRQHQSWLKEARQAIDRGDRESATSRLRQVLAENPDSAPAQAMQRELAETPARSSSLPPSMSTALRRLVSIEFRDATVRQVFDALSRTSGINFVFDRDVRLDTRTSLMLRNAPVETVLSVILQVNQLEQRVVDGSTVIVYPSTPAKIREYQQLVVRSFLLSTADPKVVANTIRTMARSRDVIVDEKLNMIIVRDSPEAVRLAERLVQLHDAPEPEVMLEVEVLEVKRSRLVELGIRWPGQASLTPLPSTSGGTLTLQDLKDLSASTVGVTIDATTVQARESDTNTNVLANPRIRAKNREKAKILIGDRLPTITSTATSTGFVSESVNYIDVGLKLDVEPVIHADGEVAIKIALEVSNIVSQVQTRSGTLAYQLGTRSASTTLRLKDGENQVLAGLIQDDERSSGSGLPALGRMPVLGRLFAARSDETLKTEIVLSITPRIVRGVLRPDAALSEFESGTESSFRGRTEPSGLTPASASASPANSPVSAGVSSSTAAGGLPATSPGMTPTPGVNLPGPGSPPNEGASPTPAPQEPPGPTRLQLRGPDSVKVGDIFTVQLFAQSSEAPANVALTIAFDSSSMQLLSIVDGDYLRQGGGQTTISTRADQTGQLSASLTRSGGTSGTAAGTLLNLTLRAGSPAEAARLQLLSVTGTTPQGQTIAAELPAPLSVRITP